MQSLSLCKTLSFAVIVLTLSACGGGGSDKKSAPSPVPPLAAVSSLSASSLFSNASSLSASFTSPSSSATSLSANATSLSSKASSLSSSSSSLSSSAGSFLSSSLNSSSVSSSSAAVSSLAADITPDTFAFASFAGAVAEATVVSGAITVSGIDTATSISIVDGQYAINDGVYTSAAGTVSKGQRVRVKAIASATANASVRAVLKVGDVSGAFSVITAGENYIQGKIVNLTTGKALADAKITVEDIAVTSDADGSFTVKNIQVSNRRILVNIAKEGFVPQQRVIEKLELKAMEKLEIGLLPIELGVTINPAIENTIITSDKNLKVVFAANSIADENNNPMIQPVKVFLTFIDPAKTPKSMPGNYSLQSEGEASVVDVLAAFDLQVSDSNGKPLKLLSPLRYFIGSHYLVSGIGSPPKTLQGYWYNAAAGHWLVDGLSSFTIAQGFVEGSFVPGALTYSGVITTAGVFAVGSARSQEAVAGCIVDENGNAIAGAKVVLTTPAGTTSTLFSKYPASYTVDTLTDAQGRWTANTAATSGWYVTALAGDAIYSQAYYSATIDSSPRSCLVVRKPKLSVQLFWEQAPAAVTLKLNARNSLVPIDLSSSDISGSMPGKYSIDKLPDNEYSFAVNIYELGPDGGILAESKVKPYMVVTLDGVAQEIRALAEAKKGLIGWRAFSLLVKDGNYSVTPVNEWIATEISNVIYFDYDSDQLNEIAKINIAYLTESLKERTSIRIEGHADERGSRESNMNLSGRRAQVVADLLKALGVTAAIEVVSYGEERPVNTGHDNAAWADNNRVEIK